MAMNPDLLHPLWRFVRGGTPTEVFETWVYGQAGLERALAAAVHLDLISTDYSDPLAVADLKARLAADLPRLTLSEMEPGTLKVAKECLRAAVEGPFFPDWEFHTLMGVSRAEARMVLDTWPVRTVEPEAFRCAILSSLGHLVCYPHGEEEAWGRYISVEPEEVLRAAERLRMAGF